MYERARNALADLDSSQEIPLDQAIFDPIYQLIMQAQIDNDWANKGIETTFRRVNGETTLVRNAIHSEPKPKEQETTRHVEIMIGLTNFKAAHTIAKMRGDHQLADKITDMAQSYYRLMNDPEHVPENENQIALYADYYKLGLANALKTDPDKEDARISPPLHKDKIDAQWERFLDERAILDKVHFWVGMEEPSFAVATISKIPTREQTFKVYDTVFSPNKGDQTIVQMDLPIVDSQMYQRYGYRHIHEPNQEDQPQWFQALSEVDQKLVRHYAQHIKDGRVIPSQLRNVLPGLKNSYQSVTAGKIGDGPYQLLNVSVHNATIVNVNKKLVTGDTYNNDVLTRQTLEAQHRLSGADKFHMVTLNSEHGDTVLSLKDKIKRKRKQLRGIKLGKPFFGFDGPIVRGTRAASKNAEHITSSNVCLNHFSKIFPNDYKGIFELIDLCNKNLSAATPKKFREGGDILRIIVRGTNPTLKVNSKALDALKRNLYSVDAVDRIAINDHIDRIIDLSKSIIKEMRRKKLVLPDQKARGRRVVALSSRLSFENNLLAQAVNTNAKKGGSKTAHPLKTHAQAFGCASGDNRTQAVAFELNSSTINDFVQKQSRMTKKAYKQSMRETVNRVISANGHNPTMAGLQGSTLGLTGIRPKSKGALGNSYSRAVVSQLVNPTADMKDSPAVSRRLTKLDRAAASGSAEVGAIKTSVKKQRSSTRKIFKRSWTRLSSSLQQSEPNNDRTKKSTTKKESDVKRGSPKDIEQKPPSLVGFKRHHIEGEQAPRPNKPLPLKPPNKTLPHIPNIPKPLPTVPSQEKIHQQMVDALKMRFDVDKITSRPLPNKPQAPERRSHRLETVRQKMGRT